MRVLIFHGYLLEGTGSNVYNARLAEALAGLGHEVHLLCQDRHPERQPFVDARADWDAGALRVREIRSRRRDRSGAPVRGRCTVYRPDIGGLLPVYVADRYEGIEARTFAECSDEEIEFYVDANVAAVRELLAGVRPHVALANHLVMGPVILARALNGEVPYAVKVHGSALEYTVKPQPERFLAPAREGLAGAHAVLVGSQHTAVSLWEALEDPKLARRTRLGPPGVDVARFAPRDARGRRIWRAGSRAPACAHPASGLLQAPQDASAFARDTDAAAAALERLDPERDALVAFVGKLIVSKGVDLLIAAWPLVLERVPRARLVVVGFGAYRDGWSVCRRARGRRHRGGESDRPGGKGARVKVRAGAAAAPSARVPGRPGRGRARALPRRRPRARRARRAHGPPGARRARRAAARLRGAGRAEHLSRGVRDGRRRGGRLRRSADQRRPLGAGGGQRALARRPVPQAAAGWLSFTVDEGAVRALWPSAWSPGWRPIQSCARARGLGWCATVRERWSWEGVARGVIAAASGELDGLERP